MVRGDRGRRAEAHAAARDPGLRPRPRPGGRPPLPDGLPRDVRRAHPVERRHHRRRPPRAEGGLRGFRRPPDGRGRPDPCVSREAEDRRGARPARALQGAARPLGAAAGAVPREHGGLHLPDGDAPRRARQPRQHGLRKGHPPGNDRIREGPGVPVPRLLARHRDDPELLRSEPRPDRRRPAVPLLPPRRADLHEAPLPSRLVARRRPLRPLPSRRRREDLRGGGREERHRPSGPDREGVPDRRLDRDGGRRHRGGGRPHRRPREGAPPGRDRAPTASSSGPSSTRTPGSARGASSGATRSRPDQDGDGWFFRDGILIVAKNGVLRPGTVV